MCYTNEVEIQKKKKKEKNQEQDFSLCKLGQLIRALDLLVMIKTEPIEILPAHMCQYMTIALTVFRK